MRELTPELYCIRTSGQANCPYYAILRLLEKIAFMPADVVITVSNAMKQYITRIYKKKKVIIPLYPFPPFAEKIATELKNIRPQEKEKTIIIYGGSILEKIYDLTLLLESLKQLPPHLKNRLQLHIIGKGDSTILQVLQRAKEELPGLINYSSFLPQHIYYRKLTEADICVVPLTLNQLTSIAVPNKLIDCIILGKPVITAALPSTIELAKKFRQIRLYTPGCVNSLSKIIIETLGNLQFHISNNSELLKFSNLFYMYYSLILLTIRSYFKYE